MSLEEALEKNTAALARLADLIERNSMPVAALRGGRGQEAVAVTGAVTGAKLEAVEHAIEHAAPAIAEAVAEKVDGKPEDQVPKATMSEDSMVFAPGEETPEFTWEGVTKQFRKYAQKHGRDEAVKLAGEFGLTIPLNKDALTPDRYEDFYYACSN